jgi:two-component system nitrogen regulation response regulator GlnG
MKPVWIIDDDRSIRWVFEKALTRENLPHRIFDTAEAALRALDRETPGAVLSDIRMPGMSGLEFMEQLKAQQPRLPIIIMTAYSDLDSAVSAFQGGAFEYLPKPFDVNHALELIHRALEEGGRVDEAPGLDSGLVGQAMLGQAPAMQDVFRAIGRLSQSHATVLITGETGTGKELVAHALHRHSPRRDKPFIALNTAAIPKDLLESELFGHERGAFTGATASRRGRFEQADDGTLFLDEIGDMPSDLQTRLLRVLADGEFYRVGGHSPVRVNVRVIAATHQALEDRVRQGLFRDDLFHRLNVIRIKLPALRERREDIPLLVDALLDNLRGRHQGREIQLSAEALDALGAHDWPGNVRELANALEYALVHAEGTTVLPRHLPPEVRESARGADAPAKANDMASAGLAQSYYRPPAGPAGREREILSSALKECGGNRAEAARRLGMSRTTLWKRLKQYGLDEDAGRSA